MAETYTATDPNRTIKKRMSVPYVGKWAAAFAEIHEVFKAAQDVIETAAYREQEPSSDVLAQLADRLRVVADQLEGK